MSQNPSQPLSATASSSKITLDEKDEELVWLGCLDVPSDNEQLAAEESDVPDVWRREDWDCPTDILYHHADHEDAGHSDRQPESYKEPQQRDVTQVPQSYQSLHPMLDYRPYNSNSLRAIKEAYDASTWDSPTDILYSHAEYDLLHGSALGLVVDQESASSPLGETSGAGVPREARRNAFGVEREPYDAETWDSPTDILYAHQSDGEELDDKSDMESGSGAASPYTPHSTVLSTPRDSQIHLPGLAQVNRGDGQKAKMAHGDDEIVLRAAALRL